MITLFSSAGLGEPSHAFNCRMAIHFSRLLACAYPCIHTSEPRTVTQKPSPSPAVREAPPKASLQNVINSDQTSPIAARAPEVFYDGSRTAGLGA